MPIRGDPQGGSAVLARWPSAPRAKQARTRERRWTYWLAGFGGSRRGLLSWTMVDCRFFALRITTSSGAARPPGNLRHLASAGGSGTNPRLSRQRSIHHAEKISDRALIHAELGVVVGGRLQGDHLLFGLTGGFELGDALARLGEHGPVVAHHRLGAGRSVARHDPGVVLGDTQKLVGTADHSVDAAAIDEIDIR